MYSLREGFRNFGDFLGPPIISELFSESVTATDVGITPRPPSLLAVGSILHLVRSGDGVWGAGIRFPGEKIQVSGVDFYAVRGPLTAKEIVSNGGPKVDTFGDPGILISSLSKYRNMVRDYRPQGTNLQKAPYLVIPHYSHSRYLSHRIRFALRLQSASHSSTRSWFGRQLGTVRVNGMATRWISPFQPLDVIVRNIIASQLTISSSLHGLITASAFGVPFRWWWPNFSNANENPDGRFKYRDFFESLPCADSKSGSTVEECINLGSQCMGLLPSPELLIQSMPTEDQRLRYRGATVS